MSIEKIRELNNLAKQMEEMKTKAISAITDRNELRIQALKKIQEYLKELSAATEGYSWSAETPITIYWLVKQADINSGRKKGVEFYFDKSGNVSIYQHASASSIHIKNFLSYNEQDFFYANGRNEFKEGLIPLVEKWREIKPYIEQAAEKAMLDRMTKIQKELADFKASYEKVVDFEV